MTAQATSWAALFSSIAAILSAIAWPGVVAWFPFANRVRIAFLLKVLGRKLSSARKLKLGQFELEEELEEAVSEAGAKVDEDNILKEVPRNQVQAAVNLRKKVLDSSVPKSEVLEAVRDQILDLAQQYESVRARMPSGPVRTRRMDEIAAGMRTLALAGLRLRSELIRSETPGRRLAAICMLQVEPRPRYFKWLVDRLRTESQAFLLFHSALAILELVKRRLYVNVEETRAAIKAAIGVISAFQGGPPDRGTLDVLSEALELVK